MISVIVPVYNNAPFIRKCVDSILEQTYPEFEIIIVDDGSTDAPESALEDIVDSRLKPIIKLPHNGVSTARNVGILRAEGEYMVFIDGDDWISPTHLELLINGTHSADCAMVVMEIDYHDKSEISSAVYKFFKEHPFIFRNQFNILFEQYQLSSPCNKIYRTELIKGNDLLLFDKSISYAEDLLFNLNYFRKIKNVTLIAEPTYHYVKHTESGTTRFHHNTSYTMDCLSSAVVTAFGENLSPETAQILMKHYIWGFLNLHHEDCPLSDARVKAEIKCIKALEEFKKCLPQINRIGIGILFQLLIRIGNPSLIHSALRLSRK